MSAPVQAGRGLRAAAAEAAHRAGACLAALAREDGHWCAELTADSTLESDYILFQLWLHPPVEGRWNPPTRPLVDKAAAAILARQLACGGFAIYLGGPAEVSASVKAYCALKLAGFDAAEPRMARLRARILELGGVQAANSYVKVNLSLFDLFPRQFCPAIPPEVAMRPLGLLYRMSSWTRAIVVPLAVVHASNPRRPVPAGFDLRELWKPGASAAYPRDPGTFTWRNAFLALDRGLKWWERSGSRALRRRAVEQARRWIVERLENSDGLAAIYPAMMYAVMALDTLGYAPDHPVRARALAEFDRLMVDRAGQFFFQPCFSPVWDTALAAYALGACDPAHPALERAAAWLSSREIRSPGDWAVRRPRVEPSGWSFEYRNDFYPDIDDTAMVLLALSRAGGGLAARPAPVARALAWLTAMQSRDGGWAAFDADNDWKFLGHVPFADHNAMLDPACPDITGRVLEALAAGGIAPQHPAVRRGVQWLVKNQEADGSWFGRWGVAYIYGTCFALRGLAAAGESDREAYVLRGGEWLRSVQNADGGWGESCASYDQRLFVPAASTPSQTAWAVLGLLAGGDAGSLSVRQGIEYLLGAQRPDGSWDEEAATGTGFPGVFYLRYGLYKDYFPLLSLASFAGAAADSKDGLL